MKGFLAITRREIAERRSILAAAAFAGLLPLAAPLVRGLRGANAAEARGWTALLLAVAFAVGFAVSLGASMLVPAIGSRRIGFDFGRPVSAAAIWGGRLVAAMFLAAASGLIVWTPAWLAGAKHIWGDLFTTPTPPRLWPLLALVGLVALFALVHAVTLVFRSRSAWIAVDAVLALITWFGASAALLRLPTFVASVPFLRVAVFFAVVALVALLAAGFASVARGRTDIRAAHRALSLVLWGVIAVAVLAANGYSSWVMAAGPSDLEGGLWVSAADRGPWLEVGGIARGATATFVYDSTNGHFARPISREWRWPVFSRGGTRAAWVQANARGGPLPIETWHLDDPQARPVSTRILVNGYPWLELSEDGSRLATLEQGLLSIHDLASNATVASARIPSTGSQSVRGCFSDNDHFRIYRSDEATIDILELDVRSRTLASVGRVSGPGLRLFLVNPDASRILAVDEPNRRIQLFDGRSGALLALIADTPTDGRRPGFLSDGRIFVTERSGAKRLLHVYGHDGGEQRTIALPPGQWVSPGGEAAPGKLVVGIGDDDSRYASWLADLDAGTVAKIADGLRPVRSLWTTPAAGSPATKLFYGRGQRSLVHLDPVTGERRVLLGKP